MLVSSRSYDEYVAFFDLPPADRLGRVLDCAAGASSFAAEANARGGNVVATDAAYGDHESLLAAAGEGLRAGDLILHDHLDRFVWDWYGSPERRAAMRATARQRFMADFLAAPATYVHGVLPDLPFEDDTFDLAVCSHLLFTWADRLDEDWHRAALGELLRVAGEVRVFPVVLQGTGEPIGYLPRMVSSFRRRGLVAELRTVPYEFQRGANQMLVLRQAP